MQRFFSILILTTFSMVSNAAPVRYDYHGSALQLSGAPIASTISGFMIAPEALLPNALYSTELNWAPYFEFSFEGESLNSISAGSSLLQLQTDALGNIVQWNLNITAPNPLQLGLVNITSQIEFSAQYGMYVGESASLCYQIITSSSCYSDVVGRLTGAPVPSWRLAEVPVPAAAWLFGSGLLGLIGVTKRKAV